MDGGGRRREMAKWGRIRTIACFLTDDSVGSWLWSVWIKRWNNIFPMNGSVAVSNIYRITVYDIYNISLDTLNSFENCHIVLYLKQIRTRIHIT